MKYTIRLSPFLAATLAAKAGRQGNVADIVRQAIEAYLRPELSSRQPVADAAAMTPANPVDAAATLAAIQGRLTAIERRLATLERTADPGSQRQTPGSQTATSRPPPGAHEGDAVYARMQALRAQGLSLTQIAVQLTAEGWRTQRGRAWHKSTVAYILKTHGR